LQSIRGAHPYCPIDQKAPDTAQSDVTYHYDAIQDGHPEQSDIG